ncbi:MAG: prepilin-type N-terminal cleavage/methylation domain-containing protein [Methylococcaceae bacterium]
MKKQAAYTLIEIMIALLLGLIVVGATVSIYIATVSSSSGIIKSARLNHDLDAVMSLMINDIKRAGYWAGATVAADSRFNPFTAAITNIQIPSAACILYSYDAHGDGTVDSYGFKFEANSIKMRKTGTTTANCDNGTWEEFVDSTQLTITALTFSFSPIEASAPFPDLPAASRCLNVTTNTVTNAAACVTDSANCLAVSPCNIAQKRLVNIQLSGHLVSNNTVIKNLSGTVEVRNNRLLTEP